MAAVNSNAPQGIAAIAGGPTNWGNMPQGWLAQIAADIASRGGMAVQQNGYDATAAVPVAAGPAWAGPSPMPAYPQSGAHMTMPGSREAWQQWGISPVVMQSSPYATAAYRTYTDPYGQLGVQPLIGFPSAYPHVLSGVPNSPFRVQGFLNALLPQMGFMPFMGMPQMPMPSPPKAQGGAPAPKRGSSQPVASPQAPSATPLSGTMEISIPSASTTPAGAPPVFPEYPSRLDRFAQDNTTTYSHHSGVTPAAPGLAQSHTPFAAGNAPALSGTMEISAPVVVPPVFPDYSSRIDRFAQDNIPAYSHHNAASPVNIAPPVPSGTTQEEAAEAADGTGMQRLLQVMRSIMDLGNPLNLGVDLARSAGVLPQ